MGLPRDPKELLTPRVRPTGPFASLVEPIVRALLPPPTPMRAELTPVPHDSQAAKDAAEAKRQRRRERNRRLAGHD